MFSLTDFEGYFFNLIFDSFFRRNVTEHTEISMELRLLPDNTIPDHFSIFEFEMDPVFLLKSNSGIVYFDG